MRLKMRLVAKVEEHQQRWQIPAGRTDPIAVTASILCLRFEAPQGENPDKVPTDPVACFEIHAADRALFQHMDLSGQDFFLELWQGVRPAAALKVQGKVTPALPGGPAAQPAPEA